MSDLGPMTQKACIRCNRRFPVRMYARKKPSRCPDCRSGWDKKRDKGARDAMYETPEYKTNRALALKSEPECHWRLPGCTGRSTQADHLRPIALGGGNGLSNLVGSCENCNRRRGIDLGNATRRKRR